MEGGSKDARARHRDWRAAVADGARLAGERSAQPTPFDGPVRVEITFRFPMPRSRPKKISEVGWAYKPTMPDLDKLIRSVGDAMKDGGLISDDARIVSLVVNKIEVVGSWSGAEIKVTEIGLWG